MSLLPQPLALAVAAALCSPPRGGGDGLRRSAHPHARRGHDALDAARLGLLGLRDGLRRQRHVRRLQRVRGRDHVPADRRRGDRVLLPARAAVARHRLDRRAAGRRRRRHGPRRVDPGRRSGRARTTSVDRDEPQRRAQFSPAVVASRPTGHGAWDLSIAADGDNVFVAWSDDRDRLWTAGSRDGGRTFVCQAVITRPGTADAPAPTTSRSTARACTGSGCGDFDIYTRRSSDAGRTLEPAAAARRQPGDFIGRPQHRRRRRRRRDHDEPGVPDAAPGPHRHGLRPPARS